MPTPCPACRPRTTAARSSTARSTPPSTAGPSSPSTRPISLLINCTDQDEVDYYWDKLTEGGEESQCGWLKDKAGLSWQVCPVGMVELLNDPDQARGQRAMQAMFGMKKLDIAALQAAADGA